MAKEKPRYKVISQYERQFKASYVKIIGKAIKVVSDKLTEFVDKG